MKIIMKILIDNYFFSLDAEYKSRINYESNWPKGLIVRMSRERIWFVFPIGIESMRVGLQLSTPDVPKNLNPFRTQRNQHGNDVINRANQQPFYVLSKSAMFETFILTGKLYQCRCSFDPHPLTNRWIIRCSCIFIDIRRWLSVDLSLTEEKWAPLSCRNSCVCLRVKLIPQKSLQYCQTVFFLPTPEAAWVIR